MNSGSGVSTLVKLENRASRSAASGSTGSQTSINMLQQTTGCIVAAIVDPFVVEAEARSPVVIGDHGVGRMVVGLIEHIAGVDVAGIEIVVVVPSQSLHRATPDRAIVIAVEQPYLLSGKIYRRIVDRAGDLCGGFRSGYRKGSTRRAANQYTALYAIQSSE